MKLILILLAGFSTLPVTAHELPDTGQTQSYTTTPGEDHDYQPAASQSSYTDNGDGTTTDNKTGLMWVKDGNSAGCNNGGALTWEAALNFCEGLTYAGYSDWRLPNRRELMSIVNYAAYSPSINATFFPNTQSYWYWTSTTYVPDTGYAWPVGFNLGNVYDGNKTNLNYVRCVRDTGVANNLPNAPISAPTISDVDPVYVNRTYTYSAFATDPDGDQVKYRFYFNSDTVYTETGYVNSGTSASVTHLFTTVGAKAIKVKTVDSKGAESVSWSPVLSVLMELDSGGGGEI